MKLFWFETYKTFSRWRTYISFGFIALIVIMTEVVMKLSANEILYRMMRSFQKDFLIFGNVLNGWFITAFIMNSLHIHIPFFITLVAGDIVSSEATSGTVRLLLIRPPSRSKIITAKYLTTLFYTTGLVIFLGLICITLGLLLFGNGDLIMNYQTKFRLVFIPEAEVPLRMLLAFTAAVWSMTVVASLAFLFSTLAENVCSSERSRDGRSCPSGERNQRVARGSEGRGGSCRWPQQWPGCPGVIGRNEAGGDPPARPAGCTRNAHVVTGTAARGRAYERQGKSPRIGFVTRRDDLRRRNERGQTQWAGNHYRSERDASTRRVAGWECVPVERNVGRARWHH